MIISHKHKFIFIHIPKNAGSSIHAALVPIACSWLMTRIAKRAKDFLKIDVPWHPMPLHAHATASEIRDYIGKETFDSYYKFAVIREPIDRAYSLYTYPLRNPHVAGHSEIIKMGNFGSYCKSQFTLNNIQTQSDYITDESGSLIINQILDFSRLEEDFRVLSKNIGIKISLDKRNASRSEKERPQIDSESLEIIQHFFRKDFILYKSLID